MVDIESPELKALMEKYRVTMDDFEYTEDDVIGEGGFGRVYRAIHKTSRKIAAVKQLTGKMDDMGKKDFEREVTILAQCNNNMFLLPFYGFSTQKPYLIVTQYMSGGSLYQAVHPKKHKHSSRDIPPLTPTQKTIIALGVAYGMAYLHSKHIIHRDLKSMNILLDERKLPHICDFGISKIKSEDDQFMTQDVGTPIWMAPELFSSVNYTNKVDIYAYAILLWEMFYEKSPFKGVSTYEVMNQVTSGKRPPTDGIPNPLLSLIAACWSQDPQDRPEFYQIAQEIVKAQYLFPETNSEEVVAIYQEYQDDLKKQNIDPPLYNSQPDMAHLSEFLSQAKANINQSNAKQTFTSLIRYLPSKCAPKLISQIKDLLREYPEQTLESKFLEKLSMESTLIDTTINLIFYLINSNPNFATGTVIEYFTNIIQHDKPKTFLKFAHFLFQRNDFSYQKELVSALVIHSDDIINNNSSREYFELVNWILIHFKNWGNDFLPVLTRHSNNIDKNIASICYTIGVSHLQSFPIHIKQLESQLDTIPDDVLNYLILNKIKVDGSFVTKVISKFPNKKAILFVLMQRENANVIAGSLANILQMQDVDDSDKIRLILVVSSDSKMFIGLVQVQAFISYIGKMSTTFFDAANRILLYYLSLVSGEYSSHSKELQTYTYNFVIEYYKAGFFVKAFENLNESQVKYYWQILQMIIGPELSQAAKEKVSPSRQSLLQ